MTAFSKLKELLSFDRKLFDTYLSLPAPGTYCYPPKNPILISGLISAPYPDQALPSLIGLDEVGRGCLAGPVVAAAVCLPPISKGSKLARKLFKLNDSKKLKPYEREELSQVIKEVSHYAICQSSVEEIDQLNILQASLLAMKRARLEIALAPPQIVLIDGNKAIKDLLDRQITVIQGDGQSAAIAAASVIAKVFRDELMTRLAKDEPHYLWQQNKGYASPDHLKAIDKHGLSLWHRRSFHLKAFKQRSLNMA